MDDLLTKDPPEDLSYKDKFDILHKKLDINHKKFDITTKKITILTTILIGLATIFISSTQAFIADKSSKIAESNATIAIANTSVARSTFCFNSLKYALEYEKDYTGTREDLKNFVARILGDCEEAKRDIDIVVNKFDAHHPQKTVTPTGVTEKWVAIGFLPDDSSFDLPPKVPLKEVARGQVLKALTDVNVRKHAADWTGTIGMIPAGRSVKVVRTELLPAGKLTQIWAQITPIE